MKSLNFPYFFPTFPMVYHPWGPQNHGKDPAWENCVSLGGWRNCAGAPGSKLAADIKKGRYQVSGIKTYKNGDFMGFFGFLREHGDFMCFLWDFVVI